MGPGARHLESRSGSSTDRDLGQESWERASRRLRLLVSFLLRNALFIGLFALGCALLAVLLFGVVYPKTYFASAVLAVEGNSATSVAGLLRLPETGYRRLASSPEVVAAVSERFGAERPLVAGNDLRVRLLSPREVRQEGVARLLELTARGGDPAAAAELANVWGQILIEIEAERAEAAGFGALKLALEERRARQQRRIRETRVRLQVAEEELQQNSKEASREGIRGRAEELRFELKADEALLQAMIEDLERLTLRASDSSQEENVAAAVALSSLADPRLEEVLDRLEIAKGGLSFFLEAHPEPQNRLQEMILRGILAGLGGALLAFVILGLRELSRS